MLDLKVYDDASLQSDKRSFVGLDVMRDIWMTVNFSNHWNGLLEHKLAATTLLAGFGFPTIATRALYSQDYALPGVATFKAPVELAAFLRDQSQYPLFGKPADALSRASARPVGVWLRKEADSIVMLHGQSVKVDDFAAEVSVLFWWLHPPGPPRSIPPREPSAESRLTCRIVTIRGEEGGGDAVMWKIPAGRNVADNFWRSGNMLGQLDASTGRSFGCSRAQVLVPRHLRHIPIQAPSQTVIPAFRGCQSAGRERPRVFEVNQSVGISPSRPTAPSSLNPISRRISSCLRWLIGAGCLMTR
ncbi:MAG: hypothetical protein R3D67_17025 [Hyphomicrobiaceae bacterium]